LNVASCSYKNMESEWSLIWTPYTRCRIKEVDIDDICHAQKNVVLISNINRGWCSCYIVELIEVEQTKVESIGVSYEMLDIHWMLEK
jgi:hypothetical protein